MVLNHDFRTSQGVLSAWVLGTSWLLEYGIVIKRLSFTHLLIRLTALNSWRSSYFSHSRSLWATTRGCFSFCCRGTGLSSITQPDFLIRTGLKSASRSVRDEKQWLHFRMRGFRFFIIRLRILRAFVLFVVFNLFPLLYLGIASSLFELNHAF